MMVNPANTGKIDSDKAIQFQLADLYFLFRANIKLIFTVSTLGLGSGLIYAAFSPRIYQGSFEILMSLDNQGSSATSSLLSSLAPVVGSRFAQADLVNHQKVLNSPSLLTPIYLDLKKSYPNQISSYGAWKRNVSIGLIRESTILSVTYASQNKASVVPALNLLLKAIQDYSLRDRNRDITAGIDYAKKQIALYKVKSNDADRSRDIFAIKHGISSKSSKTTSPGLGYISRASSPSGVDVDPASVPLGNDTSSASEGLSDDAHQELLKITNSIIERELTFTKNDEKLKRLYLKQTALRKYIEATGGGNVALPNSANQTNDKPQDLILQYKKLERTSSQYNTILSTLEKTLLNLNLQRAQSAIPWKQISSPSVDDKFISPNFLKSSLSGLLIGLLSSSSYVLLLGRIKDRIYTSDDFSELSGLEMLFRISPDNMQLLSEKSKMLAKKLSNRSSVVIVPIHQRNSLNAQTIACSFTNEGLTANVSSDLSQSDSSELTLLLVTEGDISRNELASIRSDLNLKRNAVIGFIWFGKC